jgi:phage terminase small subunit
MARERDPNRDKAFEIWKEHNGDITNREIAKALSVDEKKIAVWKQRDKWNVVQQKEPKKKSKTKNVVQQKKNKPKTKQKKVLSHEEINLDNFLDDSDLTEKQRLFCLYYVKSFNATQAAINAGYGSAGAHVQGSTLLRNPKVAEHIRELKKEMATGVFIEAVDVLNKYIKIAFSDITDFLTFGKMEKPVTGLMGPILDENNNQVMEEVNYVEFKDSIAVDGTIISEVKQGKAGVSIKLEDRMKALEKLEKYFDLFPDTFQRKIEEERLALNQKKYELDKRVVELKEKEAEKEAW